MILFYSSILILFVFLVFICILAVASRLYHLFSINLLGLFAAAISLALEYKQTQTKLSMVILFTIIVFILLYDLFFVINLLLIDRRGRYGKSKVWKEAMKGRSYRMVYQETVFNLDLERTGKTGMTENFQALQMWKLGNLDFLHGNYDDALEKYRLSLKWQSSSTVWINKSGILFEKEKYEDVIKCCDEAIKINPEREESWINRGLAFGAKDENYEAVKCFKVALNVNPDNAGTLILLGNTFRSLGKYNVSFENYEKASKLSAKSFDVWLQRGITYNLDAKYNEAVDCFNHALSLDSKNAQAYFNLGNVLNKLDENNDAIDAYQRALKLNQHYPEVWNNLGIAQSKLGQLKKSVKSYQRAIEINADYHEAWLNKALSSESLKQFNDALSAYRQFLAIAPGSFGKHRTIAQKHIIDIEKKLGKTPNKIKPDKPEKREKNKEVKTKSGTKKDEVIANKT